MPLSFLRKGLVACSGQVAVLATNVAGTVVLAHALHTDMGQYDLFRNVAMLAVTVGALGQSNAHIYVLNSGRAEFPRLARHAVAAVAALGLPVTAALTAAVLLFPTYFGAVRPLTALGFGVGVAALLGSLLLRSLLVARFHVERMVSIDVLGPLTVMLGALALRAAGRLTAEAAVLLYAGGNLLMLAALAAHLRPQLGGRPRLDRELLPLLLRQGVRLFASDVFQVLGGALAVLLLRYLTLDQGRFGPVALFTRATALCGLALLIPVALGPLLYARWSGTAPDERRRLVEDAARWSLAYGGAAALALLLGGRLALRVLYGPAFVDAQAAVVLLAPATALHAVLNVYLNLFASDGRAERNAAVLAGSTALLVAAMVLLVPRFGLRGAAAASLLAEVFALGVALAVARRRYGIHLARALLPQRGDLALLRGALGRAPAAPRLAARSSGS